MENVKKKIVSPKRKKYDFKKQLRKAIAFKELPPEEKFDKLHENLKWLKEKLKGEYLDQLERFIFGILETNTLNDMENIGRKCTPKRPVYDWSLEPEGGLSYVR